MARFRAENMIALLGGLYAGKQQAKMQMQQERQMQQGQLLQMIPHLLQADEQRRRAALDPLETAANARDLDPASRQAALNALTQAKGRLGPGLDAGALLSQFQGWKGGPINLPGGNYQHGVAVPPLTVVDPAAQRKAEQDDYFKRQEAFRQAGWERDDKRDADRERVRLENNRIEGRVGQVRRYAEQFENPIAFEPLVDQVYQTGQIPYNPGFNYQSPDGKRPLTVGGFPAQVPASLPLPANRGERRDDKRTREAREKAEREAAERLRLEQERQKGRQFIADLNNQAKLFKNELDFVAAARKAYVDSGGDTANLANVEADARAAFQRIKSGAPATPVPGTTPDYETKAEADIAAKKAQAETARKRADAYVKQVTQNLDPNLAGSNAWYRKNMVEARQNAERRLAQAKSGSTAWNPGKTAQVDAAEREVRSAEEQLGKLISIYQKQETEAAEAAGVPSKHNYYEIDVAGLAKQMDAGKIPATLKQGKKTVPNPQYAKFRAITDVYKRVVASREARDKKIQELTGAAPAGQGQGGGQSAAGGFSPQLRPVRQRHINAYTQRHGKPDAAKINEISRLVEQGVLK